MTNEEASEALVEGFKVIETDGDIFDAPKDSVLIHAVNCQGLWGSGIAEAFKSKYPAAFEVYKLHCKEKSKLPGTCLLIPPQPKDYKPSLSEEDQPGTRQKRRKITTKAPAKMHWIGCLFTSYSYGKPTKFKAGKDRPEKILSNTKAALKDLREQVEVLDAAQPGPAQEGLADKSKDRSRTIGEDSDEDKAADEGWEKKRVRLDVELGPLYACKFNSGSFGVEWKDTRALIEAVFDGSNRVMHVISPPS